MTTTKINLEQVPDIGPELGLSPDTSEMHSATAALGAEQIGLTLYKVAAGRRLGLGHRHQTSEELYLVISGSGRFRADDEIFAIVPRDVIYVPPRTMREYEAGPDGLEVVAFGPRTQGEQSELVRDWWSD
jgi:mannose-6-phosphate isomerase-like protein (cupin superfamily)